MPHEARTKPWISVINDRFIKCPLVLGTHAPTFPFCVRGKIIQLSNQLGLAVVCELGDFSLFQSVAPKRHNAELQIQIMTCWKSFS